MTAVVTDREKWPHLIDGAEGWSRLSDDYVAIKMPASTATAPYDAVYRIIRDENADSPLTQDGRAIEFKQVRKLTVEFGATHIVLYGCAHCDYVRANRNSIRPHLGRHNRKPTAARGKATVTAPTMSLADALAGLNELTTLRAERDDYKARAVKAERELAKIKALFK